MARIKWQKAYILPNVSIDVCPICGCAVVMELKDRHEQWHFGEPVREMEDSEDG